MNTDILKGKWAQLKGELKAKWGDLTDDDWTEIDGNKDKLVGKIQERYGHAKDAASRQVDDFLNRQDPNSTTPGSGTTTNQQVNDPKRKIS